MHPKPNSWFVWLFTCGALCLLASFDTANAVQRLQDLGEYTVFRWTSGDGLPHNTVRCLLQSSDGYLWVGTKAGLARFDGVRFTVFDSSTVAEMHNDDCVSLTQDSNGPVWVGTESGLLCWKNHQFTLFDTNRSKLSNDRIRYLSASPRGGLWIATFNGLNLYKDQTFRCFGRRDGLLSDNIRAVSEDDSGAIWAGPEFPEFAGNLERRQPGSTRYESFPDKKIDLDSMVHCFVQDSSHHLWWGNNHGLHEHFQGMVRDYGTESGLSGNVVKWIASSRGEGLWVVVGQQSNIHGRWGLHRFEKGKAVRLDLPSIGLEEDIICALEDREGNVWLGSRNDGLVRLQHRRASTITLPRDSGAASSVSAAPDGSIWIAAKDLLHFDRDTITKYTAPLGSPRTHAVLVTGKELLAAIDTGLVSLQEGGLVTRPSYGHHGEICALFRDRSGRPWISDKFRVTAGEGNRLTYFNPSTISNKVCCAIAQDSSGRMWFGTLGAGAFCYGVSESTNRALRLVNPTPEDPTSNSSGHLVHLTTGQGLPSNQVLCIYADDSEDNLWIGTDKGLACYRRGIVYPITTKDGLFDDRIHAILLDDFGNFWIGCSRGIYRVSRSELLDRVQGRVGSVHCISIGELDGMRTCQVTSERQPVASKGPHGLLWFATARGVVKVNPRDFAPNELLPPVVVEQVRVDNAIVDGDPPARPLDRPFQASLGQVSGLSDERALAERHELRLPPGRARFLEIRYTANSLVAPERMRFRYRLDGYDDGWQIGTPERVARYTNLRPGHYHFTVTASNNDGFWNSSGAGFSFILEPHFYTTWPFRVAFAGAIIGLASLVQNYRLGIQRRFLQIEKTVALDAERARIARDIHDDLGSRFLQLSVVGELAKRSLEKGAQADQHLERLRATTNEAFQALDEIVWATNPKQDSLEGLVSYLREYVPQFLGPLGITLHFDFPHPVPIRILTAEVRHNLFLAIKEALQNVAKHARATELILRLEYNQECFRITIKDNGCGFDTAKEPPAPRSQPTETSLGNGLANMRHRMESIGGRFDFQSGHGQGTEIVLELDA